MQSCLSNNFKRLSVDTSNLHLHNGGGSWIITSIKVDNPCLYKINCVWLIHGTHCLRRRDEFDSLYVSWEIFNILMAEYRICLISKCFPVSWIEHNFFCLFVLCLVAKLLTIPNWLMILTKCFFKVNFFPRKTLSQTYVFKQTQCSYEKI